MKYLNDYAVDATVRFMWNTFAAAGESISRAVNGTISIYKNGGTTQSTAGVTDTEDFDGLTGVHLVTIDTGADGSFYSAGADFSVVLSGATIDGKALNAVLAEFSIENRSALRPTVAGRTLDVTATGAAGIDWANVESPTTAVNLSGTNIDTDQVVASVSGAVNSVTAGVTVATNNDKTSYALSSAGILAIWQQLVSEIEQIGSFGAVIRDALDEAISSRSTLTATEVWTYVSRTLTSGGGGSPSEIADAVLDELLSGHTASGSLAAAVSAILSKANLIGTSSATITQSVVDESGDLFVSKGKDYKGSRAPSWSRTITYTGATISAARLNVAGLALTGSTSSADGVVTVSVDISRTAFNDVAPGVYLFEVELDLTVGLSTETVQFTTGKCRVKADI